jgi:hypothetical protein
MKSFFLTLIVFLLAVYACLAQVSGADSVAVQHSGLLSKIPTWVLIAVPAVYELLARLIPTGSNWSIITAVFRIFKFIVPNKATTEKTIVKKTLD